MLIRKLAVSLLIPLSFALAQAPELTIEPTDGGSILTVRNKAQQPLTGFLIELLNYPGSYYSYWQDDVTSDPIAAGAEQKIRTNNMTVGAVPDYVKIEAALYADGTSSGTADKVALLKARQSFVRETIQELIQRLEKGQAQAVPKDAVIASLKQWSDSLQSAGKAKRYSQVDINHAAARSLIEKCVTTLSNHSVEEELSVLKARQTAAGN